MERSRAEFWCYAVIMSIDLGMLVGVIAAHVAGKL